MTVRSDLSDIESLLQLLNASDTQSDSSVIANSIEQPTETAGSEVELTRPKMVSIEEGADDENRFAVHVVRGMMKSKANDP